MKNKGEENSRWKEDNLSLFWKWCEKCFGVSLKTKPGASRLRVEIWNNHDHGQHHSRWILDPFWTYLRVQFKLSAPYPARGLNVLLCYVEKGDIGVTTPGSQIGKEVRIRPKGWNLSPPPFPGVHRPVHSPHTPSLFCLPRPSWSPCASLAGRPYF